MANNSKSVLIVEDARDIQELLSQLLKSSGYDVASAGNGIEALEYLRSSETLPGVILLDLMMPKMDGYQFRTEQQKDVRLASVPVIVMTADGDIHNKTQKVSARAYLRKPFSNIGLILETIDQAFASHAG